MTTSSRFHGAMTALVTPMRDGGELDLQALSALVETQIAAGVAGLVAVGTTGESATLDIAEHIRVVEHVVTATQGRVPVIGGAGANSTSEAIELSRACKNVGVDALLHVTPYYNKPTQAGLARHFEAIAVASGLPIILYNVPGRTSVDLLPTTVEQLANVDNIVAIKEATGSLIRVTELVERVGDKLAILSGDDFTAMPLYAVGGHGVISVVSNVAPTWIVQMCNAAAGGRWDEARALHLRIQPLTRLLFEESNPTPVKAALERMGVIRGDIRLPLMPCSDALRDKLAALLASEGLT